ncbi:hypothetical protein [Stieleria neptunia]|uniref:hypothetical protein n=1 Tax=Stieleria neptunia TaxID=2527979 RepID=UPI0011A5E516|nr:hypothetical protein [Stieleria neptunia]
MNARPAVVAPHLTEDAPRALADNLGRLRREVDDVRKAYQGWGLKRTIEVFKTVREDPTAGGSQTVDWSKQTSQYSCRDDFLRLGERFRSERVEPSLQRMVFAFDGQVGRIRFSQGVINRPLSTSSNVYERNGTPKLPHSVLVELHYSRHLEWLLLDNYEVRPFPPQTVIGDPEVEEVQLDGHPCWKLRWYGINNEDLDMISDCEVYLAKDRCLLPLRQIYETPAGDRVPEVKTIDIDEFQFDSATGLWFPKQVTAANRWNSQMQLNRIRFELDDQFGDVAKYADAPVITPEHSKPPKAVVSGHAPAAVLTELAGPGASSIVMRQAFETQTAGSSTLGLLLFLATLAIWFKATRLGRALRQFLGRHPTLMGLSGISLTALVGYASSYPPGWTVYGLSMMFAGLFGLAWIAMTFMLIGDKQVSIRTALFAAACTALCFGGYSKGIKRIQVRQRMISEVREFGGRVEMGLWHLDEEGLYLPNRLEQLFGEAWSGRAHRAAIPNESFSEKNIDRWCLDEVRWLGLASQDEAAFDVDGDSLSRLGATDALWTLHVEGGYLGGEALTAAAKFPRLVDLHYDCQHRSVAKEIALLGHLERVWLTNAVVDDALIKSLRGIKNLDYVTLIKPRFGNCDRPHHDWSIDGVEVQYATLTPQAVNTLGQLSTNLFFVDCHVKLPAAAEVALPLTTGFSFRDSDLDNQALLRLTEAPHLTSVGLTGTDVSIDGIEAFSQRRPEVALALRSPRE